MPTVRMRSTLALIAAIGAFVAVLLSFLDPAVVTMVVAGLLVPAGSVAWFFALYPAETDWSVQRRIVAFGAGGLWIGVAVVLLPLTFAISGCACPEGDASTALLSARTVVLAGYFLAPLLLIVAALLPSRQSVPTESPPSAR